MPGFNDPVLCKLILSESRFLELLKNWQQFVDPMKKQVTQEYGTLRIMLRWTNVFTCCDMITRLGLIKVLENITSALLQLWTLS